MTCFLTSQTKYFLRIQITVNCFWHLSWIRAIQKEEQDVTVN